MWLAAVVCAAPGNDIKKLYNLTALEYNYLTMALITSQQLNQYYDEHRDSEIVLSKDIIQALALDPLQVYVRCGGDQWPCIINSTSFMQVKIIISTKSEAFKAIAQKDPPPVSVRFGFFQASGQSLAFFIAGKVDSISQYPGGSDLAIVTIKYTQKPPEDFIEIVGRVLDANAKAVRLRDEKIVMNADVRSKLNMGSENPIVVIQKVPRKCVLISLSFGGAQVALPGIAKFIVNKTACIQLDFDSPHETISVNGVVKSVDSFAGRNDVVSANIDFDDSNVPISYKIRLNEYMHTLPSDKNDNKFSAPTDDNEPARTLQASETQQ